MSGFIHKITVTMRFFVRGPRQLGEIAGHIAGDFGGNLRKIVQVGIGLRGRTGSKGSTCGLSANGQASRLESNDPNWTASCGVVFASRHARGWLSSAGGAAQKFPQRFLDILKPARLGHGIQGCPRQAG